MLNIRATWNVRCLRHPSYKPEQGEGGIKGGCEQCTLLLNGYKKIIEFVAASGGAMEKRKGVRA